LDSIIYRRSVKFEPDFDNLLQVLQRKIPSRPVLFEFGINNRLIEKLSGGIIDPSIKKSQFIQIIKAFANAGYDYATIAGWRTNTLVFPKGEKEQKETHSLDSGFLITDRDSFEKYNWPDPTIGDYEIYYDLKNDLPDGMKLIASSNGGIFENVVDITGLENLCFMTKLDEELTTNIFNEVGSRFLKFYELVAKIETIGACIVNDDWGFKNQTFLSPSMLRRWVFPWHKKIVEAIHKAGKPAILHSCGQLKDVMNDIIFDMKYDAKHSFEDEIVPVEDEYEILGNKISILGGIDMDFLARSSKEKIFSRSKAILEKGMAAGGYALGSGNSIPEYIPDENYFAMISAVNFI
jgi:uroporphyrinogen decarboxylase